jgi:hypothetical protein
MDENPYQATDEGQAALPAASARWMLAFSLWLIVTLHGLAYTALVAVQLEDPPSLFSRLIRGAVKFAIQAWAIALGGIVALAIASAGAEWQRRHPDHAGWVWTVQVLGASCGMFTYHFTLAFGLALCNRKDCSNT